MVGVWSKVPLPETRWTLAAGDDVVGQGGGGRELARCCGSPSALTFTENEAAETLVPTLTVTSVLLEVPLSVCQLVGLGERLRPCCRAAATSVLSDWSAASTCFWVLCWLFSRVCGTRLQLHELVDDGGGVQAADEAADAGAGHLCSPSDRAGGPGRLRDAPRGRGGAPSGIGCCWSSRLRRRNRVDQPRRSDRTLCGRLVGLRQHRGAGLRQDLRAGEVHHLAGHVGVADPALRRGQVLDRHVEVVDGVLEPVLVGTEVARGRSRPS